AGIAGDSIRCTPGTYQYTSIINSLDRIQSFQWKVNGVAVSSDSNLTHLFTAGNYTLQLIVQTINGCYDSTSRNIIIDSVTANFSVTNPTRCATDLNVQFNNLSGSKFGIASYAWTFGDGTVSTATNPAHLYPGYGNYDVRLVANSVHGCADTFNIQPAVVLHPLPTVRINGDSIHCTPGTYNYSSLVNSIQRIQTFQWKVNGVAVSTDSNLVHNFAAGNYTIQVMVRTINGCIDSFSRTIIIDSVGARFNITDPVRCAINLNVQFNNISASKFGISSYAWTFGDGGNATATNPIHTYPGYGSYDVRLIATSVHGCTDTFNLAPAVVLHPLPTAAINGDSIHCRPGTYQYTSAINSVNRIQAFQWLVNDVAVASDSNLNHSFAAGNYTVKLIVRTINGCYDTVSRNIIIDSVKATFTAVNPTRCATDLTVQFNNGSGSKFGISSYGWTFGDNGSSTTTNPSHTYPGYGNYNVRLIATSVHGCFDTLDLRPAIILHPLPAVAITGDSINCKPGTFTYNSNVSSIDAIQGYEWKVNGSIVPAQNGVLQRSFLAGNYIIGVKVTTSNGCTGEYQRSIIVDSVKALFSVQRPIRCGSTDLAVTFNNLSGSKFGISNYKWNFGDGSPEVTSANPVHNYAAPGTYYIKLIAQSIHGCTDTFALPQPVIIYATPTVAINSLPEVCAKSSLQFTSQVTSQDQIIAYEWRVNNIVQGTATSLTYLFPTAGSYDVKLTVTTQNGCAVIQTKTITVRALPVPAAAPNTAICIGSSIQLNAFDGNNYSWSPATALSNPNIASPTASPVVDTRYRVTVTNQYGCIQKDSILIRVDKKVGLQHSPDMITCRGTAVRLNASGNTPTFIWDPATGLNSTTGTSVTANPDLTTTYRVIGISQNVCPSDTGFVKVTVGDVPTVNAGPDLVINAGTQIVFPTTTTGGVTGYLWTPSTGLDCSTCPTPGFTADQNIRYRVSVRTQYGCTASDEIQVTVLCNKGAVYIPNAFTPNGDGRNDIFYVNGFGLAKVKSFNVFDRWGKNVFSRNNFPAGNSSYGWNGRVGGMEVNTTTTFVYVIEVECSEGTTIPMKGSVILIR
ncbi:MAG: PKD domain-containing protein, partial [Sphingobacteriales bacterium]